MSFTGLKFCVSMAAICLSAYALDFDSDAPVGTQSDPGYQNPYEEIQWGNKWVGGRAWTCVARDRRGRTFSGQNPNANRARSIAMNRCWSWSGSGGCMIRSCR
jgi:hypothetical protein